MRDSVLMDSLVDSMENNMGCKDRGLHDRPSWQKCMGCSPDKSLFEGHRQNNNYLELNTRPIALAYFYDSLIYQKKHGP